MTFGSSREAQANDYPSELFYIECFAPKKLFCSERLQAQNFSWPVALYTQNLTQGGLGEGPQGGGHTRKLFSDIPF